MLVAAGSSELHTIRTADITHRRKSAEWDGLLSFFYTVNSSVWCLKLSKNGKTVYNEFTVLPET